MLVYPFKKGNRVSVVNVSPVVSLRVLGNALRQYRVVSGHTLSEAARAVDYHPASLSKAESGKIGVHPAVVKSLLDFYGEDNDSTRENLVELARQGRKRGWWHKYRDLMTVAYLGMESAATQIHALEHQLIPGLLQTTGYFRALLEAELGEVPEHEADRRVKARNERQTILVRDEPCELWAVMDESVLHRPIGEPKVMVEQFDHLIAMSRLPNVNIQVLPFAAGAHASLSTRFTILHFAAADDAGTVFLEQLHWRDEFVEDSVDVDRFSRAFDHARATADPPNRSRKRLRQARDNFKHN